MAKDHQDLVTPTTRARFRHRIDAHPESLQRVRQRGHPDALVAFAAHLPAGARAWVSFSLENGAQPGLITTAYLEDVAPEADASHYARDFRLALTLAFAGHAVERLGDEDARPEHEMLLLPEALPEARYLERAGIPGQEKATGPAALEFPAEDTVLLPHPFAQPVRIDRVLQALSQANEDMSLSVSLSPIHLEAFVLRQLSAVVRDLDERLSSALLPVEERMRLVAARGRLQGWLNEPRGVVASLYVQARTAASPWLIRALETAAYGRPNLAAGDTREQGIDLSCAWSAQSETGLVLPGSVGLQRLARAVDRAGDRDNAQNGVALGRTSAGKAVLLSDSIRSQHSYICGATGTGKTSLIRRMVLDDIRRGYGVGVIDPHGDLIEDVIGGLDRESTQRVDLADLSDENTSFRLNLLENDGLAPSHHANFVCNQLIMAFKRILYRGVPEAFGPMFEAYFRNALSLLMLGSEETAHLGELDRVFTDRKKRHELLQHCDEDSVRRFWTDLAERVTHTDGSLENIAPYIVSKLTQFTGNSLLRPILCAQASSVDFFSIMQHRRIFLANLSKGTAGEMDSRLMGALLTTKIFAAAMRQAVLPPEQRTPFRLYLDEFQSYSTDLIGDMLSEGRKFGLELTVANQSTSQIDGRNQSQDIAHAVLANCGTILAFRAGPAGAGMMAEWIGDGVQPQDLIRLPNYTVVGRLPSATGAPLTRRFETIAE